MPLMGFARKSMGIGPRAFRPGFWYGPLSMSNTANAALILNAVYFVPFVVPKTASFDRVGMHIAAAVASSSVRIGLYSNDYSVDQPKDLIAEWGTVSGATTGEKTITISQGLKEGLYWLAAVSQGAAANVHNLGTTSNPLIPLTTVAPAGNLGQSCWWTPTANTTGALPATVPALAPWVVSPRIMLRCV